MDDAALSSDHVNYLILRYLQESGHENAAKALYRDWHRPDQCQDPEDLTFAPTVKPYELVNIIQDGLHYDRLQSTATSNRRRFSLVDRSSPRPTSSRQNIPPSRRPSAYAPPIDRADFPTSTAKRQRRSQGSELDHDSDAVEADRKPQQDDVESAAASPTRERAQSEPEAVVEDEPPVETTSAATQTERKSNIITDTTYWPADRHESTSILQSVWGPPPAMTTRLLTVGESLCRVYDVSTSTPDGHHINHRDLKDTNEDFTIWASCWHPSGQRFTYAAEVRSESEEDHAVTCSIVDCDLQGNKRQYELPSYLLQPEGMMASMQYNELGTRLMTVVMNGETGMVAVWDVTDSPPNRIAMRFVDNVILCAAWVDNETVVLGGISTLELYSLKFAASSSSYQFERVDAHDTASDWDKLDVDPGKQLVAAGSTKDSSLLLLAQHDDGTWQAQPDIQTHAVDGANLVDFKFQHQHADDSSQGSRLAVAYDTGHVYVFEVQTGPADEDASCKLSHELYMGHTVPAYTLAWSPDGTMLAVTSDEAIKIWRTDDMNSPVVSWVADAAQWYEQDDNNLPRGGVEHVTPNLSWDVEGKRLAFSVGRELAIITLREDPDEPEGMDVDDA